MADLRSSGGSSLAPAAAKKRKTARDLEDVCDAAWNCWQNFLENEEDSDELVELIELLRSHCSTITSSSLGNNDGGDAGSAGPKAAMAERSTAPFAKTKAGSQRRLSSRVDLLPALMSAAATALAEVAISYGLAASQSVRRPRDRAESKASEPEQQTEGCWKEIHQYLQVALSFRDDPFGFESSSGTPGSQDAAKAMGNPGCWSMVANFARMSERMSVPRIIQWYLHAADASQRLRREAINVLQASSPQTLIDDDTKAWIESVVLNHMVGVELDEPVEIDDVDTVESENSDQARNDDGSGKPEQDERWSTSAVEATSRFMAAMLLSTIQEHDAARRQLELLDVTHRLHPNVWTGKVGTTASSDGGGMPLKGDDDSVKVRFFAGEPGGFLPKALYDRLCLAFAPDSPYWDETDYSNRGYYSYFMELTDKISGAPLPHSNLIHHVVAQYLLPAVESLRSEGDEPIVGYEWWVHTRPVNASLGHNLHFDTDEAILNKSGEIYHPVYSAVLYLTGDPQRAGATIVLDQTPDSSDNATRCWRNIPAPNSLLVFPGNLLHGVLPCPGDHQRRADGADCDAVDGRFDTALSSSPSLSELDWLLQKAPVNDSSRPSSHHRLTLLVGFWTRRVPDHVETNVYGPCGPLPPASEYQWVQELCRGYNKSTMSLSSEPPSSSGIVAPRGRPVPCVSPAWEKIRRCDKEDDSDDEDESLPIPSGMLDHRYFVKDAPQCFRAALFDREGDEDESDGEYDIEEIEDVS
jgi:hypothetical protein